MTLTIDIVISNYSPSGSAASRVDLKAGDQLVTMDNASLSGLDHIEIIKMIQKVTAYKRNMHLLIYCCCRLPSMDMFSFTLGE